MAALQPACDSRLRNMQSDSRLETRSIERETEISHLIRNRTCLLPPISPRLAQPMKTPAAERLHTPTLDAEASALLQRISEEGGFAYVKVATLAAAGDFRAAEAAREMAWEQLHSGPWHSVLPVWRDAYSMACLHVAAFHHGAGNRREALRVLDMGVIMGGMLLRKDLDAAIAEIAQRSAADRDSDERMKEGSCVLDAADVRLDEEERGTHDPLDEWLWTGSIVLAFVGAGGSIDATERRND
ncbi:hypothetical protein ACLOJK_020340 [Asimina triloba]